MLYNATFHAPSLEIFQIIHLKNLKSLLLDPFRSPLSHLFLKSYMLLLHWLVLRFHFMVQPQEAPVSPYFSSIVQLDQILSVISFFYDAAFSIPSLCFFMLNHHLVLHIKWFQCTSAFIIIVFSFCSLNIPSLNYRQ